MLSGCVIGEFRSDLSITRKTEMFLANAVSVLDHHIGGILDFLIGCLNQYIGQCVGHYSIKCQSSNDQSIITCIGGCSLTDSDSPIVYISGLAVDCFSTSN